MQFLEGDYHYTKIFRALCYTSSLASWLAGCLAKSEAYVVPKTKYMTLGPKFYVHNNMVITPRRKHLQS